MKSLNQFDTSSNIIWEGNPSHYQYFLFHIFFSALALVTLGVSLLIPAYFYLVVKTTKYTLSEDSLIKRSGILSRKTHELMLYRIQDISMDEPFLLRMVNLTNIKVYSTDIDDRTLELSYIKDGERVRRVLRKLSEKERMNKGVRAFDMVA